MSATSTSLGCTPGKRRRVECLQAALAHGSESAVWRVQTLLQGRESKQRSGAFKRQTATALAPYMGCVIDLEVPAAEGPPVRFAMSNVKELLRLMSSECQSFCQWLRQQAQPMQCVIAHDETTAGNVLATDARQKIMSVDLSFTGFSSMQTSALAWLPLACISCEDVARARGGASEVTAEILREWHRQSLGDLFLVGASSVSLELAIFVADHDAQRDTFCCKGSAGLRCCMFCSCVSKASKAGKLGDGFHSIEEHRLEVFEPVDPSEVEKLILQCMAQKDSGQWQKGQVDALEKALGFNLCEDGFWACPIARRLLPLSKVMNDSMHCYFANGVAAAEVNLLVATLRDKLGVDLQAIKVAIQDGGWHRPAGATSHGENNWWVARLFLPAFFAGKLYKGSATQCQALIPLFRFLLANLWSKNKAIEKEAQSFLALARCCDTLRHISKTRAFQKLTLEQQEHHRLFHAAYTGCIRPKHHHRHHLSAQYEAMGYVANCWGVEAKHKDYKSIYADHFKQFLGDPTFSRRLLPRLLLRHVEQLKDRPILLDQPFALVNAFSAEAVYAATGIENARIASHCRLPLAEIRAGDCLFWRNFGAGGRCLFFLCQENSQEIWILVEPLLLQSGDEAQKVFRCTQKREFVRFSSLQDASLAAWLCEADPSTVVCLP